MVLHCTCAFYLFLFFLQWIQKISFKTTKALSCPPSTPRHHSGFILLIYKQSFGLTQSDCNLYKQRDREKVFCFCIPLSLSSLSNSVQFKMVIGIEIYELGKANMCSKSSNPSPLPIFLTQSILLCILVVYLLLIILMVDALQKFYVFSWVEFHHLFFLCLFGWSNTGTQRNDQQESCTVQTCKYMK